MKGKIGVKLQIIPPQCLTKIGTSGGLMSYQNPSTFEDSYILPTSCEKASKHLFSELVTAIRPCALEKDT